MVQLTKSEFKTKVCNSFAWSYYYDDDDAIATQSMTLSASTHW